MNTSFYMTFNLGGARTCSKCPRTFFSPIFGYFYNEIFINKKMYFDKLNEILDSSSYPSGVPNEIAINIASDIIKKKNSVILTGEGADELFGGYGRIFSSIHD